MLAAVLKFQAPTLPFLREISQAGVGTSVQLIGKPFAEHNKSIVVSIHSERDTAISVSCKLNATGNSIGISAFAITGGSPSSEVLKTVSFSSQQRFKLRVTAKENVFEVFMNDVHVLDFVHRVNPLDYRSVRIEGPVILEEVLITPGDIPLSMTDPMPPPPSYNDARSLAKVAEINRSMGQMNVYDNFPAPPPQAYRPGGPTTGNPLGPSPAPYPAGAAISTQSLPNAGYPPSTGVTSYPGPNKPPGSGTSFPGATPYPQGGSTNPPYPSNPNQPRSNYNPSQPQSRGVGFVDMNRPSPQQVGEAASLQQKRDFIEKNLLDKSQSQSTPSPYPQSSQPIPNNAQPYPGGPGNGQAYPGGTGSSQAYRGGTGSSQPYPGGPGYPQNSVPIGNQGTGINNYPMQPSGMYPPSSATLNPTANYNQGSTMYPGPGAIPVAGSRGPVAVPVAGPMATQPVVMATANAPMYSQQSGQYGGSGQYRNYPGPSGVNGGPGGYNQYGGPGNYSSSSSSSPYGRSSPITQPHYYQPTQAYDRYNSPHLVQYPPTTIMANRGGCYTRSRSCSSSDSC